MAGKHMYKADSPESVFGEEKTKVVIEILKKNEWKVIRLDTTNDGKAALFSGEEESVPAMDLLAIGNGKTIFLDSKAKHQSTWTYKYSREDHGIDKNCYDNYIKQCKEGNVEPWIALYEERREVDKGVLEESNVVLLYRLDQLEDMRVVGKEIATYGKDGMVYWRRSCFQNSYKLDEKKETK